MAQLIWAQLIWAQLTCRELNSHSGRRLTIWWKRRPEFKILKSVDSKRRGLSNPQLTQTIKIEAKKPYPVAGEARHICGEAAAVALAEEGRRPMRRLIVEEPYSETAVLSARLGLFAFAVAIIGVALSRAGLDPAAALAVLGGAAAAAGAAILSAVLAFIIIWRSGRKGAGQAFAGLMLALLLLAYPAYVAQRALNAPILPDLSADLVDPPSFSLSREAQAARGGATPPASIPFAERRAQSAAYPQIQPILLDLDERESYAAILKAISAIGWRIVDQRAPGGRSGLGHIDAVARSFVLGFPYDVTLRIRPLAGRTRVDMRSVSRFGRYDFGANQRNFRRFESALEAEVDKR